jgi:hypothetical protein
MVSLETSATLQCRPARAQTSPGCTTSRAPHPTAPSNHPGSAPAAASLLPTRTPTNPRTARGARAERCAGASPTPPIAARRRPGSLDATRPTLCVSYNAVRRTACRSSARDVTSVTSATIARRVLWAGHSVRAAALHHPGSPTRAMAYTEFTDRDGTSWRVWETRPRSPQRLTGLAREWAEGWLTFQSSSERRRLAPVPAGWEGLSPERLDLLRRLAQPATREAGTDTHLDREERPPA